METVQPAGEAVARCGLQAADVCSRKDALSALRGLTSSLSFLSLCFVNFSISHWSSAARAQVPGFQSLPLLREGCMCLGR